MHSNRLILTILSITATALSLPQFDVGCMHLRANDDSKDIFFHKQVTDKIHCKTASECSTTDVQAYAFSYSISAGVNTPFTSAGFGVTQEWSNGSEYQCVGEEGDTICVWLAVPYLEYEVEHSNCDYQDGISTLRAPKENGKSDGDYYCVTGEACRTKGEGYWGGL